MMDDATRYRRYADWVRRLFGGQPADMDRWAKTVSRIPENAAFGQHKRAGRDPIIRDTAMSEMHETPMPDCWLPALVVLLLASTFAPVARAQVPVSALLTDGTGTAAAAGYLHFELENCGNNFPSVAANITQSQNPWTVVKTSFDLKPSQTDGSISGQVLGNDQILCGNVASTYYQVTAFKDEETTVGPVDGQPFVICSALAPATMPCSNPGGGTWNPAVQQPAFQPVPAGLVQMYGNDPLTQVWTQLAGTEALFYGTFDFANGLMAGPVLFADLPNLVGMISGGTVVSAGSGCVAGSLTIGAPTLSGGVQAQGTYTCAPGGGLATIVITVNGSGYTAAPVATIATGTGTLLLNWQGFSNLVYVQDALPTSPCTGGGLGAWAFLTQGVWNCGTPGGGGGGGGSGTVNVGCQYCMAIYAGPVAAVSGDPLLTDNGSLLSYAGAQGIALPSDGVHAGGTGWVGNTLPPPNLPANNYFGFLGPNSNSFGSYFFQPNATPPTNGQIPSFGAPATCTGSSATCIPLNYVNAPSGGSGSPTLDNCTGDETGNMFYSVTSLSQYFSASWQAVFGTTASMYCMVHFAAAQTSQTITLVVSTSDTTTSHTAQFKTCDAFVTTGTLNVGSLTCASAQTFTVPGTAYVPVTLTFNVQSSISGAGVLIVDIVTQPSGTAPTANMLIYPTFQ